MGTYKPNNAGKYHVLAKRKELNQNLQEFESHADFVAALKANPKPQNLRLWVRHLTQRPDDWNFDLFGTFPEQGLLAVYARLPSSNKTMSNPQNDKHVCIFFANEPNSKLQLKLEVNQIFGWYCRTKSADTCNRYMSTGCHVMSLAILLLCPYWDKGHVVNPMPLMDTRDPRNLQPQEFFGFEKA